MTQPKGDAMQITYEKPFERFVDNMVQELNGIEVIDIGEFIWSIDIGAGHRCVLLIAATNLNDRFHVCYEFHAGEGGLEELLLTHGTPDSLQPLRVMVGPDAVNRQCIDGRTVKGMLEDHGYEPCIIRSGLRSGLSRVRSLVTTDPGKCDITIEPRCSGLIEDLRRVQVKRAGERGHEYVRHEDSHTVDALRYLVTIPYGAPAARS